MIGLSFKAAQGGFFDRKVVLDATDKLERKALSKFGAFVRTRAKSSIRKRKKSAPPGSPPSSHTGLLKKFIYFSYDLGNRSVVIGPTRLDSMSGLAPTALEHGGRSTRTLRRNGLRQQVSISIRPHPYMGPAFEAEQSQLPALFANKLGK